MGAVEGSEQTREEGDARYPAAQGKAAIEGR